MASRYFIASGVREYVFCPRSWGYRRQRVKPPPEAVKRQEARFEAGNRFHREHGEAVCRASRELKGGALLIKLGLAVLVYGVLAWCLFSH